MPYESLCEHSYYLFHFAVLTSQCQLHRKVTKSLGPNPVLFLDSLEVDITALQAIDPMDISNVIVVKPKKAKRLIGDKGRDGAVYVMTTVFAKLCYWNYLSSKSRDYKALFPSSLSDTAAQYILNGEVLTEKSVVGKLFWLSDDTFKSVIILDKSDGKYLLDHIYPKRYFVLITSKHQKGGVKK